MPGAPLALSSTYVFSRQSSSRLIVAMVADVLFALACHGFGAGSGRSLYHRTVNGLVDRLGSASAASGSCLVSAQLQRVGEHLGSW